MGTSGTRLINTATFFVLHMYQLRGEMFESGCASLDFRFQSVPGFLKFRGARLVFLK
jgi:hypothetical protein